MNKIFELDLNVDDFDILHDILNNICDPFTAHHYKLYISEYIYKILSKYNIEYRVSNLLIDNQYYYGDIDKLPELIRINKIKNILFFL
jgi:hypothetical protein